MAYPGQTATAYITFLSPNKQLGKLSKGTAFELCLGSKTLATGTVTEVMDLWRSASESKGHS